MSVSVYIDPARTIVTRDDGKNIGLHVDEYTLVWGPPEAMQRLRDTIDRALAKQRGEPESELDYKARS